MTYRNSQITIVIILYNPNSEQINNLISLSEHYNCIVFDNTCNNNAYFHLLTDKTEYITQGKNIGIAAAQNIAIKRCLDHKNIDFIVFLDQDSKTCMEYPELIVSEYKRIKEFTPNIAILGPMPINSDNGQHYASIIHKENITSDGIIIRKKIISSGSCIETSTFKRIGLNEERLFIDLVDSEWCWRANSKGYLCCITPNIKILHKIGQRFIKLGKYIDIISSPYRYYYQYRNYIIMIPRKYVPLKWKTLEGIKMTLRIFYVPFFTKEPIKTIKYIAKGIFHGIRDSFLS